MLMRVVNKKRPFLLSLRPKRVEFTWDWLFCYDPPRDLQLGSNRVLGASQLFYESQFKRGFAWLSKATSYAHTHTHTAWE